jgi:acetyltransferase-like isoleucine patch superfamily enzyme
MQDTYLDEHTDTRETLLDELSKEKSSSLEKYQQLFVGESSLLELFKYELLTGLLSFIPGALGFLLRKTFYKSLFAEMDGGVVIGSYVTLRCPGRVSLGKNVFIDNNAVLDAKGVESQIRLGESVLVGKDAVLSCLSSKIILGEDVSIGPYCFIRAGLAPVKIGSFVTIGAHTAIVSGNPSYDRRDIPIKKQIGSTQGVTVGDDVWMGVGVRIVDGVKIGNGSVIGVGAVVIEDVPEFAIAAGVPARIIGYRNQ